MDNTTAQATLALASMYITALLIAIVFALLYIATNLPESSKDRSRPKQNR